MSLVAMVLATIPDVTPEEPPGLEGVATLLNWISWGVLMIAVVGSWCRWGCSSPARCRAGTSTG